MSSDDEAIRKVETAEAWHEFCDLLKKAGDVLLRDELEPTTFDRGEGLRYLSRLVRAGLISFAEATGPEHPVFRTMPEMVKMGLDNPDNFYRSASVDPRYDYRLRGKRGTIHYLSFAAQNQNFAARSKITGGAGHLEDSELELGPDGSFEIVASQQEQPGNWLRMNPDTKQILVRQTFLDRLAEQPVEIEIECLGAGDGAGGVGPPPPLDPARVPGSLLGSAMYAIGCAQWFYDWVIGYREQAPDNAFHLPPLEKHLHMGGDPNIRMWLGFWKLAPDEALVIEVTPPKCDYWNLQLGNLWAESLDYHFHRTHVNSGQAVLEDDGSVRIVVAHEDPGIPGCNWLDTAGHHHGTMGVRWVRADEHPKPETRVVKLAELRA
jgi:hypothetical protein